MSSGYVEKDWSAEVGLYDQSQDRSQTAKRKGGQNEGDSVAGELQPTHRDRGGREKPHPPGQKPGGGGREGAPWGWVGPGQLGWGGAGSPGQPKQERKEGAQAWTHLRKQETSEGSSAGSTRADPGASQRVLGVQKTLAQV